MWRKVLKIVMLTLFWAAAGYYVWWSAEVGRKGTEQLVVERFEVSVTDSNTIAIITSDMVRGWITDAGLDPVGRYVERVRTAELNRLVTSNPFVGSVKTYVDYSGRVSMQLTQRMPLLRINTDDGYSFYYTNDGHIVPTTPYSAYYLPMVTGSFELPFEQGFTGELESFIKENKKNSDKSYIFLCKLIKFVEYISHDGFWNSGIVQICVNQSDKGGYREPEIELIPRVGDNIVLFGTIDDYENKLERLSAFFHNAQGWSGWQTGGTIDVRYANQIVCRE